MGSWRASASQGFASHAMILGALLLSVVLVDCLASHGQVIGTESVTLEAVADCHVNSSDPDGNYGDRTRIYVQTPENSAYFKFDLSSIPPNAVITSARLRIYLQAGSSWSGPYGLAHIGSHYCADLSWTETGLTFNNRPSFESDPTDEVSFSILEFEGYRTWDVTEDANKALGTGSLTEVLRFTSGTGKMRLSSKESSRMPQLILEYSTKPIFNVSLGSLQDGGPTFDLGYIEFWGQVFSLPADIRAVEGGYEVEYVSGYDFTRWETGGGVSVQETGQRVATATVSGHGSLTAIGNPQVFSYVFDDGEAETDSSGAPGNMLAVRFTPLFVGEIRSASFYMFDLGLGPNSFNLRVLGPDRADVLAPISVTPSSTGWFEVDLSSYHIPVLEDFYVAIEYVSGYNPDLGVDSSDPDPERSFLWNGTSWRTYYNDYMIRCTTVSSPPVRVIPFIDISVTPTYISAGRTVSATGAINPPVGGVGVTLTYTLPDSSKLTHTAMTESNGSFRDSHQPMDLGTWTLTASWEGDENYESSRSYALTFKVSKGTSWINCAVPYTAYLGQDTIISGVLGPALSLPIRIEYSTDGGTTWGTLATVNSNPEGEFSHTWRPSSAGSYKIRATYDGSPSLEGSTSYASYLTVTKVVPAITCGAEPASLPLGSSTQISGAFEPARRSSIKIEWRQRWGAWKEVATLLTGDDGGYSLAWTPDSMGALELRASCEADNNYQGATSSVVAITVEKVPSTITCAAEPAGLQEGAEVTVSGRLEPPRAGAYVDLTYTRPDGSALNVQAVCNEEGRYAYSFAPAPAGQWSVRALWEGDEYCSGSESPFAFFSVPEPGMAHVLIVLFLLLAIGLHSEMFSSRSCARLGFGREGIHSTGGIRGPPPSGPRGATPAGKSH